MSRQVDITGRPVVTAKQHNEALEEARAGASRLVADQAAHIADLEATLDTQEQRLQRHFADYKESLAKLEAENEGLKALVQSLKMEPATSTEIRKAVLDQVRAWVIDRRYWEKDPMRHPEIVKEPMIVDADPLLALLDELEGGRE